MERRYPVVEFEAELTPDGSIAVPARLRQHILPDAQVTVRITAGIVPGSMRKRGITEEIVERVSELQLEERDHVLEFFGTEGALASDAAFRRRAGRSAGRRH